MMHDQRTGSPRMPPAVCCHQAMIIHVSICGKSVRVVGVVRERPGGHLVGATNPFAQGSPVQVPHLEWATSVATHTLGCALPPNHDQTCVYMWSVGQAGWRCGK